MHPAIILSTPLFLATTITSAPPISRYHTLAIPRYNYSKSPSEIIASNIALTQLAQTIDISVVAITTHTPPTTAQVRTHTNRPSHQPQEAKIHTNLNPKTRQIPTSLNHLTNAISANESTASPNHYNPPTGTTVARSYGLFANTVEELMYDCAEQRGNLLGVFGLQSAMYSQLVAFNSDYAGIVLAVVNGTADRIIIGYNTRNATSGIDSAMGSYAP